MHSYLSKALSILFHPIIMPTAGIFITFQSSYYLGMMPTNGQHATYLIVFVSTFVLPLIMISLFMLRKVVKSLEMTEKQERFVPFMVTSIFYFFSYYTLNQLNAPGFISAYILGAFITIFIIALTSIAWKISAHMAGLGGVVGMILALADIYQAHDPYFFIEAIIIAGLVGSARLHVKAHSLQEVGAGFLLGLAVTMSTIYIYPL